MAPNTIGLWGAGTGEGVMMSSTLARLGTGARTGEAVERVSLCLGTRIRTGAAALHFKHGLPQGQELEGRQKRS